MKYQEISKTKRKRVKKKIIILTLVVIIVMSIGTIKWVKPNHSIENDIPLDKHVINDKKEENPVINEKKWQVVDESYFQDAVFLGDSRTEGFMLNNNILATVESYTHKGLTVDTIFTSKVINKNGKKMTIMEALKKTNFTKVYLMLGINETGWPYTDVFISHYERVVDEIMKINPNCIIYIQSIIPVTEKVSNTHPYVKNSKIKEFNNSLQQMAYEKQLYYLNVAEVLVDENGVLPEDAAVDGIHLNKSNCIKWFEYLKNHAVGE